MAGSRRGTRAPSGCSAITAHEAIGQSIHLIVPPEGRDQVARILDRTPPRRAGRSPRSRTRAQGRPARERIEVTVSPVHDRHGQIIGASKTARDITARKAWEADSRECAGLRDARRAHGRVVARPGARTRCGGAPSSSRSSGSIPATAITAASGCLALMPCRGSRRGCRRQSKTALATSERLRDRVQLQHAQPASGAGWKAAAARRTTRTARPTMLYGLGIDITDRVRAVEALREADRRKDEFLATLAHELRNPLAPISSGLHILRTAGDNRQVATTARQIMERQVAQMVRLVDDLLDVARITTGKVELRRETVDLAAAIQRRRGNQPTVDRSRGPVHHGDAARRAGLRATPIARGSRRSSPTSSTTARSSAIAASRFQSRSTREGGQAVVRVRDAGMGIPREALKKIFDMFGQADRDGAPLARRPRHRPVARQADRRNARRHRRGAQ